MNVSKIKNAYQLTRAPTKKLSSEREFLGKREIEALILLSDEIGFINLKNLIFLDL